MSHRGVEWLCAREFLRFSRRHRRYLLVTVALYLHSLRGWKRARVARYGYCFLQMFDDIMDGDRHTETPPDIIAAQTISAWETNTLSGDDALARIGSAFAAELRVMPLLPDDEPHADVLILLETMRLDSRRVAEKRILTRAEIKTHLRRTFFHSLNLLLIASRHRTRAAQIPDLVEAMGWCSVVRDLDDDLRHGLVNIPDDVVLSCEARAGALTSRDLDVRQWLAEEEDDIRPYLARSAKTLETISATDPPAAKLLRIFQRSVTRYASA